MKVLFICLGNSERSVIAQELYNKKTKSNTASSAGVKVSNSKRSDYVIKLLKEEGIDISNKPKTQLTKEMIKHFDKIFVLCDKNECPNYLLKSKNVVFWKVENPWNKDYDFLVKTKEKIENYIIKEIKSI